VAKKGETLILQKKKKMKFLKTNVAILRNRISPKNCATTFLYLFNFFVHLFLVEVELN
jgi:hypothetical protein